MGYLIIPKCNNSSKYQGDKKKRKFYQKDNYSNKNAVKFVIEDITRSRPNEKYFPNLVGYGAKGVCYGVSPQYMVEAFKCVQSAYNIERRGGRRIYHEVYWLSNEEMQALYYDISRIWMFGMECSEYYFNQGYQVVFAIHSDGIKYHIHFAVNAINYLNGKKYHTSLGELKQRNIIFDDILQKYMSLPPIVINPIRWINQSAYRKNL